LVQFTRTGPLSIVARLIADIIGGAQMSKQLVSLGLIAAAMFANPAMAAWYEKTAQSFIPPASFTASGLQTLASLPEVRGIILPANRQPGAQAPGRRGATRTAQSLLPPASFTASGLQTLASLPEVPSIILPANRQPGAKTPGNGRSCPALPSSTSTPAREEGGKMPPTFPAKGMSNVRTVR
jgi:hypothetical protein